MAIINPEAAQKHLRVDSITDEIFIYIGAAEEYAQQFLNRRIYDCEVPDEDATGIASNELIEAGILLILGHLYENRETVTSVNMSSIPMGALNLLQPYRIGMGV